MEIKGALLSVTIALPAKIEDNERGNVRNRIASIQSEIEGFSMDLQIS